MFCQASDPKCVVLSCFPRAPVSAKKKIHPIQACPTRSEKEEKTRLEIDGDCSHLADLIDVCSFSAINRAFK